MKKIKIIAELVNKSRDIDGRLLITFRLDNFKLEHLLMDIKEDKYSLEIKEITNKRTLQQNSFMWALIDEIDKKQNGYLSDPIGIYCQILEMANAKYEYLLCEERTIESLRKSSGIRALDVKGKEYVNGIEYTLIKVFIGTSQFNKKEMAQLLDTTINYANELGIETEYYKNLMEEIK